MRRYTAVAAALFLATSMMALAQRSRDGVIVDPDVHNVVFENEYVRVIEARASHGHKSPMHSHPTLLLISIGSARVKLTLPDGKTAMPDLRPGEVRWLENPEHSWELIA